MRVRLKLHRVKESLNQSEIADKLGITITQYNRIENGKTGGTLKVWRKIQKLLDIKDRDMWQVINKDKE